MIGQARWSLLAFLLKKKKGRLADIFTKDVASPTFKFIACKLRLENILKPPWGEVLEYSVVFIVAP